MRSDVWLLGSIAVALLASGCSEIAGLGRYHVSDAALTQDAGDGMDAATEDAGVDSGMDGGVDGGPTDAGCLVEWYRDEDEDGFGDATRTMSACAQPEGHVDNADDCDDTLAALRPGATETCDALDQDCDGAVDEGLIGPIGDPIPIVDDLGGGFAGGRAEVVATLAGYAVVYQRDTSTAIRATFLDRAGEVVAADVFVGGYVTAPGPTVSDLHVARFTTGSLDQVYVLWKEPTRLQGRLFSSSGVGGSERTVIDLPDTDAAGNLEVQQFGSRLLVSWTDDTGMTLLPHDPVGSSSASPLTLPNPPGDDSRWEAVATVDAAPPYAVLSRATIADPSPDAGAGDLDGGLMLPSANFDFLRTEGVDSLTVDETWIQPWDYSANCTALDRSLCGPLIVSVSGTNVGLGRPGLVVFEGLVATNGDEPSVVQSSCLSPSQIDSSGTLTSRACVPLPLVSAVVPAFNIAARGSVATVVVPSGAGVGLALREIALTESTSGSELIDLPGIEAIYFVPGLSMRGVHGGVLGEDPAATQDDVILQRLGCEP